MVIGSRSLRQAFEGITRPFPLTYCQFQRRKFSKLLGRQQRCHLRAFTGRSLSDLLTVHILCYVSWMTFFILYWNCSLRPPVLENEGKQLKGRALRPSCQLAAATVYLYHAYRKFSKGERQRSSLISHKKKVTVIICTENKCCNCFRLFHSLSDLRTCDWVWIKCEFTVYVSEK